AIFGRSPLSTRLTSGSGQRWLTSTSGRGASAKSGVRGVRVRKYTPTETAATGSGARVEWLRFMASSRGLRRPHCPGDAAARPADSRPGRVATIDGARIDEERSVTAEVWKDRDVAAAFLDERSLLIPDRQRQLELLLRLLRAGPREPRRV